MTPREFILAALDAAEEAKCPFPDYVACEAALESGFGQSKSARQFNNLFGMKDHKHSTYGSHVLPTKEFMDVDGDGKKEWVTVKDAFETYPDWAACLEDRMNTLKRLAPRFPHYKAALEAKDGETFIREVSQTWATDPGRAEKILRIHATWKPYGLRGTCTVVG